MKRIFVILMVLAAAFCVFAAGNKESGVANSGIRTVKPGVLTVATSPDYAPYEFYKIVDGKPQLAGFDMAFAQAVADELGLKLEVIPMDFDGIIAEVQMGNVDLGISGFSPTPERAEVVDLSDIYYKAGQCFVCLTSNKAKFPTLEATNNPMYKFGVQTGAIQVDLAEQYSPKADIVKLTKVTDIIPEVLNGKLDGAYIEKAVAESYARNYSQLTAALDVPYSQSGNVAISKKGSQIIPRVNEIIKTLTENGKMDSFVAQANIDASGDIIEGMVN